jgi:hypothetical protein
MRFRLLAFRTFVSLPVRPTVEARASPLTEQAEATDFDKSHFLPKSASSFTIQSNLVPVWMYWTFNLSRIPAHHGPEFRLLFPS